MNATAASAPGLSHSARNQARPAVTASGPKRLPGRRAHAPRPAAIRLQPAKQPGDLGGGSGAGQGVGRFATGDRQRHQAEREASSQQREPNGAPERKSTGDHGPIVATAATGLKLQGRP